MFVLEDAVQSWKAGLIRHHTMTSSDIAEMEAHLRDEMEKLRDVGLTQEESFVLATRRIGDTGELAAEFAKVNTGAIWCGRALWMLAGILAWHIISAAAALTTKGTILLLQYERVPISWFWFGASVPLVSIAISVLLAWAVYRFAVKSSWQPGRLATRANVLLALGIGAATLALDVMAGLPTFVMAHIGTPEQMGQFALGNGYCAIPIALLWPFLLAGLLMLLMRTRRTQPA